MRLQRCFNLCVSISDADFLGWATRVRRSIMDKVVLSRGEVDYRIQLAHKTSLAAIIVLLSKWSECLHSRPSEDRYFRTYTSAVDRKKWK